MSGREAEVTSARPMPPSRGSGCAEEQPTVLARYAYEIRSISGSVRSRFTAIGTSMVDQVLFSLGGFIVSWIAARELGAADLARFAIGWQTGLGLVAVVSEAIVTPAVARFAGSVVKTRTFESRTVETLLAWSLGALIAVALISLASPNAAVASAALSIGIAGSAFSLVRGMRYARRAVPASVRRNLIRLAITVFLLAAALVTSTLSVETALAIGAVAFLLAASYGRFPRHRPSQLRAAIKPLLHEAGWYTLATAVRIIGYATGLILLVQWFRGSDDAAAVAAILILVGPTQVVSSSLPLLFLAELGEERTNARRFRRLLAEQLIIMTVVVAVGLGVAATIYSLWVGATVGDPTLRPELQGAFAPFAVLFGGIAFGSWIAAAFKAMRWPMAFTVITALSGVASLACVATPLDTVWLAAIPYLVVTLFMGTVLLVRLTRLVRSEAA